MSDAGLQGRNLNLGARIVQTILELRGDKADATRALLEQSLAADQEELGQPPLSLAEHRERAVELAREADSGENDQLALERYREATTHAYWSGDSDLAEASYRAYVRLRTLVEQV